MIRILTRIAFAGLFTLILGVTVVFAHASLLTTTPANNDVLTAAPRQVLMNFNEPVGILSFTLFGPDGKKRDLTSATTGGQTVTVALPGDLPQGTEALTWHIVSADGHPVSGTLVFSIGKITSSIDIAQTDRVLAIVIWLARVLVYVGLFVGAGSLVFGAIAPLPRTARRLSFALIAIGAIAAVFSVGLQGADGPGLTLDGLLDPHAWTIGWGTTYATTIVAVLAAYTLGVATPLLSTWPQRMLAILTLVTIGLSLALSGHASAADPQWLTRPAVFLHVTTVAFWTGALMPLGLLLFKGGPDCEMALKRFSAIIPFALLPLVATGTILTFVQLGPFGASWLSPYAAILAAKLALVLALFLLAAWNRWRLTGEALGGSERGRRWLVFSIRTEMVIVIAILGLVAGWRFTVPPRAIAQELSVPAETHVMGGSLMAEVIFLPGRAGETGISIHLMDAQLAPTDALSVKLSLEQKTAGVGPIEAEAIKGSDGFWRAGKVDLPVSGTWTVSIDVRTGTFDITTLTGRVEIQ